MTNFRNIKFKEQWAAFAVRFRAAGLDRVPILTAGFLEINPTPEAYETYCRQRALTLQASLSGIYTAPEQVILLKKRVLKQVQGEAVWVANAMMSDELDRQVKMDLMTVEAARDFVNGGCRDCLNALLPSHMQLSLTDESK